MKRRLFVLFFIALICLPSVGLAHPGKTDENGGHYDYETGEYHYHHGYPAHQHENGVCPYDYDDKTPHDSGNSISVRVAFPERTTAPRPTLAPTVRPTPKPTAAPSPTPAPIKRGSADYNSSALGGSAAAGIVFYIIFCKIAKSVTKA